MNCLEGDFVTGDKDEMVGELLEKIRSGLQRLRRRMTVKLEWVKGHPGIEK